MGADSITTYVNQPLSSLEGSSPKTRGLLTRLVGRTILDLLYHFPSQIQTRIYFSSIQDLATKLIHQKNEGSDTDIFATLTLTVSKIMWPPRKGLPIRIRMSDATGQIEIVYFTLSKPYLVQKFPLGSELLISGKATLYNKLIQMSHPDFVGDPLLRSSFVGNAPLYPLTSGLSHSVISKALHRILLHLKYLINSNEEQNLFEWILEERLKETGWPSWIEALEAVHTATSVDALDPQSLPRTRLAYDEIFAHQLTLLLSRRQAQDQKGRSFIGQSDRINTFIASLPYTLTSCQQYAIHTINKDMGDPLPMLRLLQGDVGSGKTVVSFIAALNCLTNNVQVALMAPTEILAKQHFHTLGAWCKEMGFRCECLQGGMRTTQLGKALKEDLEKGLIHLVVGTHALLEDDIKFKDLGLMIIDEQHRFGVNQRLALYKKGFHPDLLVTSATPIPRTLQLTQYGDLDISALRNKPQGRLPISTHLFSEGRIEEISLKLKTLLQKNQKIYWICPLVEESETLDLTAAIQRHTCLSSLYPPDQVSLLHGQMNPAQKQEVMTRFAHEGPHILVATTVVEVGMDIPEATLMVIEHAERFGLSQLHQLRGRVGRNDLPSHCFLIYSDALTPIARQRLFVLKNLQDGFKIAEEDLRLRGYGALLGTTQSGSGAYKAMDPYVHAPLFEMAHKDLQKILALDPFLESPASAPLLSLLTLFQCHETLNYLRAG